MRTRLGAERLDDRLVPSTCTWSGSYNTDWGWNVNWVGGVVPGSGDDVVFPSGSYDCSVWGGVSVASITTQSGWGHDLTVYGDIAVAGDFDLESGTVTTDGGHGFGDGDVTVGGDATLKGAVTADGIQYYSNVTLSSTPRTGIVVVTGTTLVPSTGGALGAGTALITNNLAVDGTLTGPASSTITTTGEVFGTNQTIQPAVTMYGGSLDFEDGATFVRGVDVGSGAIVYLNTGEYYYFGGAGLTVAGSSSQVQVVAESGEWAYTEGEFSMTGGTLYVAPGASLAVDGSASLFASTMSTVWNLPAATAGKLWASGYVTLDTGAALVVDQVSTPRTDLRVNLILADLGLSGTFSDVDGIAPGDLTYASYSLYI